MTAQMENRKSIANIVSNRKTAKQYDELIKGCQTLGYF